MLSNDVIKNDCLTKFNFHHAAYSTAEFNSAQARQIPKIVGKGRMHCIVGKGSLSPSCFSAADYQGRIITTFEWNILRHTNGLAIQFEQILQVVRCKSITVLFPTIELANWERSTWGGNVSHGSLEESQFVPFQTLQKQQAQQKTEPVAFKGQGEVQEAIQVPWSEEEPAQRITFSFPVSYSIDP